MKLDTCIFCKAPLTSDYTLYSNYQNANYDVRKCHGCNVKISYKRLLEDNDKSDAWEIAYVLFCDIKINNKIYNITCFDDMTFIDSLGFNIKINSKMSLTPQNVKEKIKTYIIFS